MAEEKPVTACLIVIGNEVLSGRTQDANLQYLAKALNDIGVRLMEARVIPDVEATIVATVNECRAKFDHVITTGGIGPTHDDITSASIAKAFGVRHVRNPQAEARLRRHYARPEDLNAQRLRMAEMPEGAELIDNPVSVAPGFRIGNVIVLAGVPRIMQAMFEGFRHRLRGGAPMLSRTVVAQVPEGKMAAGLGAAQAAHPGVEIGSYPFFRDGKLGASLVVRGTDVAGVAAATEAVKAAVRAQGGEPIDEN
ncbi:MAG: molybdopterin-binding protein [Rhodospirillales bacterium RIFCSPLOWO2_12_FULL_67_15]|nr:MAG: molybdopterin-binding protein [Rhodospirillales bacterium RIFCSPLOWO2_12_FULL_67_15]